MDKFSGLYIKQNGEWQLHGKLDSDVDGKIDTLCKLTDNGGVMGKGKSAKKLEEACVIHSTKGLLKSRRFNHVVVKPAPAEEPPADDPPEAAQESGEAQD